MPVDHIRYDILVQEALRGMVRDVLTETARNKSMPGEHHFFITFDTTAADVRLSDRLRAQYPEEMTVVLQHQFWDLNVTEHTFEVGLSFSGIPERLLIPFDALTGFFDPSVQFGLKFDSQDEDEDEDVEEAPAAPHPIRGSASEPVELKQPRKPAPAADKKPAAEKAPAAKAEADDAGEGDEKTDAADAAAGSAEVVSLDAFRKKN